MAFTNTWDETAPLGSVLVSTVDDVIRAMKLDLRERLAASSSELNSGRLRVQPVNATGLASGTEAVDLLIDLSHTLTFLAGAIAAQRAVKITPPTYAFASASTITKAATLAITGPPVAGSQATITDTFSLLIEAGNQGIAAGGYLNFGTTSGSGGIGIRETSGEIEAKGAQGYWTSLVMPVGSLVPFAGATAPSGWLLCYGQAISRATYANLFAVISTTYGNGDGSTTFNVPDLRGRTIAGQDDMGGVSANRLTAPVSGSIDGDVLGGVGGEEAHTLTIAEMPTHTHSELYVDSPGGIGVGSTYGNIATNSGATGGGGAHNNVQPTIILNYIIKV